MVANKMTGEKGVLFTAAYVTAFEKMRERIGKQLPADPNREMLNKAKLNNSRARLASVWLKMGQGTTPEYEQICKHYASAELTCGTPVLPLPKVAEKTYSAAEVGAMLGGVSANMVGRMANQYGLKTRF